MAPVSNDTPAALFPIHWLVVIRDIFVTGLAIFYATGSMMDREGIFDISICLFVYLTVYLLQNLKTDHDMEVLPPSTSKLHRCTHLGEFYMPDPDKSLRGQMSRTTGSKTQGRMAPI
jgi:hypothetical protein